jgi:uncharacterized protein
MATQVMTTWIKGLSLDRVWVVFWATLLCLWAFNQAQAAESLRFTLDALLHIAPFILVSVLFAAYANATGLDQQVAKVFSGHPVRAISLAALFGAFSPFCSCGVVPIIAGLLGAGVPLAPVMAFWIASPLMDPEMFVLMLGVFGIEMVMMKTIAALFMGLMAGGVMYVLRNHGIFASPLKKYSGCQSSGCGASDPLKPAQIVWAFWEDKTRLRRARKTCVESGLFLFKWLALAFLIESLMLAYIPTEDVGRLLGDGAWWSIPAAVLIGIPAYLNGYAAIPMVSGLIELGVSPAAGLGFMIGGGVTSIPAAMAVFALVKKDVFALYLLLGIGGALTMSFAYGFYLSF